MKLTLQGLLATVFLVASSMAHAESSWSAQDYDLYPGDFNGDGLTDMLYIAKDPSHPNGIVVSDGSGLNTSLQTWGNAYLGIPWSGGVYNIVVADFDGDGRADLFLQRNTPGDHYLLLTEDGGVGAISQTVSNDAAGLTWSADGHQLIAGDFNGDGKADLFFQAPDAKGLNAVVLADANGQFTAAKPDQSWNDGYTGLNWAANESHVYAGDFNGDGRADLLVRADPIPGTGPGTLEPAQFVPNSNGVVLAQVSKQLFAVEGLQAWSREGFGADWSPLNSVVVVGDFNADGRSDVFLQGVTLSDASYILYGHAPGAIFATSVSVKAATAGSADTYRLMAGRFTSQTGSGLYAQSLSTKQLNFLARLGGGALTVTQADASLAAPAAAMATAAPTGPIAALVVTPTSAGRTAGQFAVSAMGAATYQIPIWTPPGARGIEPHLALTYASGSPDGMMGPGWNLSGLSSIARCNKTYAENGGAPAPITSTLTDDFCLDGNRLRVTLGTYGAAGSQYQTEIANFSRVTANGTAGSGPSYFVVEGKDGLTYEYGNTADSKAYASSATTPYAWMLNKVRDRQGNNLVVVYATTSGSLAPSNIQYTHTPATGTTYPYKVVFTYQARFTNLSKYVAGGNIQQTQVLAKVDVQSSSVSVRQYKMTYETAPTTQRDRLSAIQECAGSAGTDCLWATTIGYQNGTIGIAAPTTASGSGTTVAGSVRTADINGDGREDLLFATQSGANFTWWVQFASGAGYGAPISTGAVTTSITNVLLDDFIGEGKNSVLAPNGGIWYQYRWTGSAFVATTTNTAVYSGADTPHYATADTDGDGLPDLVDLLSTTTAAGSSLLFQRNTSSGTAPSFSATTTTAFTFSVIYQGFRIAGNNSLPHSPIHHMDFDGDGRDDIVLAFSGGSFPNFSDYIVGYASRGATAVTTTANSAPYGSNPSFMPARWNDDQCTDLIANTGVAISKCDTAFQSLVTLPAAPSLVADWDGDGRTDALVKVSGVWQVYRSLGTTAAVAVLAGISVVGTGAYFVTDQNGDGLGDMAFVDTTASNAIKFGLHNGASAPADLATTISDGWNVAASPTYVPATLNNYTKGTGAVFPEMDFIGPMYVVSRADQSDGLGGIFYNTFSYFGARINRQGRGFEGFAETQSQDSRSLIYQYVYYNQVWPYTGTVYQRDTVRPNNSTLITRTVNTFSSADPAGAVCTSASARCFPYLKRAVSTSYEISATFPLIQTSDSNFTYDTYGNPLTASTTTTDNDSTSPNYNGVWTSLVTNTYASQSTATWCFDKPTRTTTQNTVPGPTSLTRTVDHVVDLTNCRYTSETVEPLSTTLKAVTNFGYDTCGNVNSVGVVGLDSAGAVMPTRTTTSSYGTRCTFPESVTNALSQTATTAYNYSYGVKASSTDPNNVSVSWLYDNFGRKNRENRPDSTFSTWQYDDCLTITCSPTLGNAPTDFLRLKVTETRFDSGSASITSGITFADGLERARYSAGYRVLGTLTWTKTTYDTLGRKVDTYLPYSAASNGYHHFTYDLLNRPTSDQLYNNVGALDRTTGMAYAGLKTTMTDARTNSTTKWTDVAGKLRQIIDPAPGGTTLYTYDPFGNLSQISDATSKITQYQYNIRGFKTDSTDPDTGHWVYTPNSLNELVKQRDAKLQDTSFGYDLLGRMTSRTEPESTTATSWVYGTSAAAHNIGRLASLSKPDGYAEGYTYDSLGRPAGTTITEDTNYAISYAYNSLGAADTVTYPASTGSPFVLKYLYSYGALQQVKDNAAGTVFWALSATNDSSLPMTEVLGNGVNVSSTYTLWTNELITRKEGTGGVSNSLQDLAYQWDPNGNLQQRKDQKQLPNQTEIFVHDTLNRVSSSTLNGTTNLTVGYDEAGNITSKLDVGTYDYTTTQGACNYSGLTAQPHAVRKAGTAVYCYDANGNATSRQGGALAWTSYNLPSAIASGSNSTTFNYNASHQRWKQDANYAGVHEVTYYIGGIMEKTTKGTGATEYRHLIPAGSGSAILTRRSDLTNSTYYTTSDHLGSGDLVLSSTATVLAHESFTPFGARRGANWQGIPTTADYTTFSNTTRRGFTGHEMLDSVSLIHMNGRVYDPTIGRFLSADPIIQTIALSQAINPFSYVMNIPLTLTDPSGLSWLSKLFSGIGSFLKKYWKPILAIVVAIIATPYFSQLLTSIVTANSGALVAACYAPTIAMASGAMAGALAGGIVGGWKGALVGALSGGMFGGISQQFNGAWTAGRVLEQGAASGITSELSGGSFRDGFELGVALAGLQWGAEKMREEMVRISKDPRISEAARRGYIGGSRPDVRGHWTDDIAGGRQGQEVGRLWRWHYKVGEGSWAERLVETFGGPHDWLSSIHYTSTGLNQYWGWLGERVFGLYSVAAIVPATAIVGAANAPYLGTMMATNGD